MKKTLQSVDHVFVRGALLSPAHQLVAWIERQRRGDEPRLIRLPVILQRGQVGFTLRGARIGTAADAPIVDIGDAALGVGLGDRSHAHAGDTCGFMCAGYWRGDRFDVVVASSPLSFEALVVIAYAEVEGESHN